MNPIHHEDEIDEAPLDPATERVQRKLKRLLSVSMATMGLGFLTVAVAVFYRLAVADGGAEQGPRSLTLATQIAADERLVNSRLDDEELTLVLDGPNGVRILVLDAVLGDIRRERLIRRDAE